MAADRSYVAQNTAQRDRLKAFVSRTTNEELATAMPAGWTVAAVLAHVAFWDQRIVVVLQQWKHAGVAAVPKPLNHGDVEWINDAGKLLCLALPPRAAADLAVAAAETVDRRLESLEDEFLAANTLAGTPVNVLRATHRREHLDEIARALGR